MSQRHKTKLSIRLDLRGRIHAAGHRKLSEFARLKAIKVRTLYSVLDGVRANGPEARRIIRLIGNLKTPA